MGDEWDMASDCEKDAIDYACELANEEFYENYEKYFEEECAILAAAGGGNNGQDDFGEDDGIMGTNGEYGDWNDDFGGEGNINEGGGILDILDIMDFFLSLLEDLLTAIEINNIGLNIPKIHIPTPKITEATWLELDMYYMFLGDSPSARAFQRAVNDIPRIKVGAFLEFIDELLSELNDEFAGYPEAYVNTIFSDRGNSGIRTINNWDPNLAGILPHTSTF